MSYEDKVERAKALIEEHNSKVPEGIPPVDFAGFRRKLAELGGTTETTLKACSFEDLESAGLPRLLARGVARIFREDGEDKKEIITAKKAMGMTPMELLLHYDPRDAENAVGKRLAEFAHGRRFIVFDDNGAVLTADSAKLLEELRDGYSERATVEAGGRPRKTYRVGERPEELADENPLYRGEALRPDGTCDHTVRSWVGIPHEVRALVHLATHNTNEIAVRSVDDAHRVFDLAGDGQTLATLRARYPRASVLMDELAKQGKLPTLKVERGAHNRKDNPFTGSAHHEY